MKQRFVFFVLLILLGLIVISCNNQPSSKAESPSLCPRNEYSRNGVETVYHYEYKTKEGVVDEFSKKLSSIEKYDSLGNVIYYKGNYYPNLHGVDISTYHYEVRRELDLPWDSEYTYKMEYSDTVFVKASLFDGSGKYIARVEQHCDGNTVNDSVYVRDRLIYVRNKWKDVSGRDSLIVSYDNEYDRKLSLAEEERLSYTKSGNVEITNYVTKSRDFLYSLNHRYETSKKSYQSSYDEKGRLVKSDYGTIWAEQTYDERGFVVETITGNKNEKNKTLYKATYYDNGLIKNSYGYADMTVCTSYSEYEYDFYPYSRTILH